MNKFWLITAWLLTLSWISTQVQAQRRVDTKSELCENLWQNETVVRDREYLKEIKDHEEFINTNIFELKRIYWNEKCQELINQHFLIEINKIRKQYWKPEFKIDSNLKKFAQNRAKYLFSKWILDHWEWEEILPKRLQRNGLTNRKYCGENLWQWQTTIKRIINGRMNSAWHREMILSDKFDKIWLWVISTQIDKNTKKLCTTRVLNLTG